jgi:hypothetical protein
MAATLEDVRLTSESLILAQSLNVPATLGQDGLLVDLNCGYLPAAPARARVCGEPEGGGGALLAARDAALRVPRRASARTRDLLPCFSLQSLLAAVPPCFAPPARAFPPLPPPATTNPHRTHRLPMRSAGAAVDAPVRDCV